MPSGFPFSSCSRGIPQVLPLRTRAKKLEERGESVLAEKGQKWCFRFRSPFQDELNNEPSVQYESAGSGVADLRHGCGSRGPWAQGNRKELRGEAEGRGEGTGD